ncbi:hypothetical protein CspHIS471_0100950 [Cutaneotrichosporon sp. HIS471]|nr:hypothetical protein CspHIS471_0100950 [Cutaneotrichosporon sp. HIS471]
MVGVQEPNKRRVSYIIPAPGYVPDILELPGFGAAPGGDARSFPYIRPKGGASNGAAQFASRNPFANPPSLQLPQETRHPQHRLGISALALDTSTVVSGTNAPGGILYTGGRDGLVASWETHVPHTRRRGRRYRPVPGRGTGGRVRWERLGDGGPDWEDDDGDDDGGDDSSSEDDEGTPDVTGGPRKRKDLAYEDRWEVDHAAMSRHAPPPTTFRESVQTHTDWVNAMVLCNKNQTVITASSDRTIRAWSPHDCDDDTVPALIGHHTDYVRSLAFARHPGVLFSGALDRDISVWDIANPKPNEPVLKVRLSEADDHGGSGLEGEWGSIYALGVDPAGHSLAAGTPERVVRLWDPRAGERSVTKLVGHSECVRAILFSDDGRYMLTGSSDTTIKLWSVGEHRCLHTFNHHTSSVWSLFSNHPNLERFYSGSRDGHLCVVDVEQCGDMSEGECLVLAREGEPGVPGHYESKTGDEAIRSICAMDDEYVWTATSSSDVHCWRDVGRRVNRLDADHDGASYHQDLGDGADEPLVSAHLDTGFEPTSIMDPNPLRNKRLSIDDTPETLMRTDSRDSRTIAFAPSPLPRPEGGSPTVGPTSPPASPGVSSGGVRDRPNPTGYRRSTLSGASIPNSILSEDDEDNVQLHGLPYESLVCLGLPDSPYSFGLSSHAGMSAASLASGRGPEEPEVMMRDRSMNPRDLARRAFEDREVTSEAKPYRRKPIEVIKGSPGLIRSLCLNDRVHALTLDTRGEIAVWHLIRGECLGRFAAEDVAEALTLERGVTSVLQEIKLHPQEVLELVQRRIEGKNSVLPWCQLDTKVGQITVHLEGDRVFAAEILAEEIGIDERDLEDTSAVNIGKLTLANLFRGLIKAEQDDIASTSPTSTTSSLPGVSRSPQATTHIPMKSPRHRQRALSNASLGGGITPSINIAGLTTRAQTPAIRPEGTPLGQSAPAASGWLSLPAAAKAANIPTPSPGMSSPSTANHFTPGSMPASRDYFSLRKDGTNGDKTPSTPSSSTPATNEKDKSSGGLLKKGFKGFGKKKTVEASPMATVTESKREEKTEEVSKLSDRDRQQLLFLDMVRSRPFGPPSATDAPALLIPPSTRVIISEQAHADGAYIVTYRSTVGSTERDIEPLELNSPFWLLNFLFTSATPEERRPPKIPLILLPEGASRDSGKGLKVQASRTARVRGVLEHLHGVIAREEGRDRAVSDASAMSGVPDVPARRPEDTLELWCGQHLADPEMKVATLKQYYWRGGPDMVLHYRRKS